MFIVSHSRVLTKLLVILYTACVVAVSPAPVGPGLFQVELNCS